MYISRKTCFLGIILSLNFSYSFAGTDPAMDEYFMQEGNIQKFNAAVSAGIIKKLRGNIIAACADENSINPGLDCACIKEQFGKISDKEFYYESIMANMEYQESVKASRDNDMEKVAQLKKKHEQRHSVFRDMDKACNR